MRKTVILLGLLLLAGGAARAVAGFGSEEFGKYVVHYSALPSTAIPAPVARNYGITRSRYRGLLNVSVLKKQPGAAPQAVEAEVSVRAKNRHGQATPLELREVREGEAVYYIAGFAVADGETLKFEVSIETADGAGHTLNFNNVFYAD